MKRAGAKAGRSAPDATERGATPLGRQFYRLARRAFVACDFTRAEELARVACEKAPDWAEAHRAYVAMVQELHGADGFYVCWPSLADLVRLGAATPMHRYNLGCILEEKGRLDFAVPILAQAIEHADRLAALGLPAGHIKRVRKLVRDHPHYTTPSHVAVAMANIRPARGAVAKPAGGRSSPQPAPRQPSRGPGASGAPARGAAPTAPPAAAPAAPPPPAEGAPPPCTLASLAIGGLDAAGLRRGSLGGWRLADLARRIALAERFDDLLCLRAMTGVEEHAYQVETVRRVLRVFRGRALLADEVGLGKTVEAGMVLKEFMLRGMVRSALVLVPPALVSQWREELSSKFGIEPATTEDRGFGADGGASWVDPDVLVASIALARSQRHRDQVRGRDWDMVIVDEAHHAKARGTETWRLVDGLRSRFLLLLTATPVENDLEDLYSLVSLIRPGQLGTPAAFKRAHATRGDGCTPKDPESLRRLLSEVMVRNTRAVADVRLPPRFATTLAVDPTADEAAIHEALTAALRAGFVDSRRRLLLGTLLQQACSSPDAVASTLLESTAFSDADETAVALARVGVRCESAGPGAKEARLVAFLRESGEQAIVFTRFRATADRICRCLDAAGIGHRAFVGGMSATARDAAVEAVREGRAQALVATPVGGEGRNMHFLRAVVNYDLPWNPMEIEQRIGRVHRIGQTREVLVVNLSLRGTVEDRILSVLDSKINLFELVVGELDMILGQVEDERDFASRVLAILGESRTEADVDAGFARLGDELSAARRHFERVRALDATLFSDDFGT